MKKPEYREGDPRSLTLLEVNARFMTHEQFTRLVANVRRDGYLTSVPLVWFDPATERRIVLSGNHRVKAALEVGLPVIGWLEVDEELSRQQQVALQLSHNSIAGQDDPATLNRLYDELDDVDWREYSGLDDKALGLLDNPDMDALSEANLDYLSVMVMFLPWELERAQRAFDDASVASRDHYLLGAFEQYEPMLAALTATQSSYGVGNIATALGIILDIFERHLGELREGWYDAESGEARHKGMVPLESITEGRTIPAAAAAIIQNAIERVLKDGDAEDPLRALELICADYLATPAE